MSMGRDGMTGPWDEGAYPPPGAVPPPPSPIPGYVPPPGSYGPVDDRRQASPPPPPPPPPTQLRYADWGERVGATLVDWALIFAPVLVLSVGTAGSRLAEGLGGWLWLAGAGWVAWLNGSKGQSPGKALLGIKLVREADGSTLGGPVGLVRSVILLFMGAFSLGLVWLLAVLWPLWNRKHRALHDMVLGASVVAGYPRARFGRAIFLP